MNRRAAITAVFFVDGALFATWASRTCSNRVIASAVLPARRYARAKLLRVVSVDGWSGPRFVTRASRTFSNRAMALAVLPASSYAPAKLSSVVSVSE